MRTIEEIKKDQDQAIYDLGFHTIRIEQEKIKIFKLAKEAEALHKQLQEEPKQEGQSQ